MEFCPIASGSSGNCIFIGDGGSSVLIDAGISAKRIEAGLNGIGHTSRDIDAILVTHEHSDHIKGLGILARRYGIPVYLTPGTAEALKGMLSLGKIDEGLLMPVREDTAFSVGSLKILPFRISHDAAQPVAYRVESGNKRCAVATDLGEFTDYTVRSLTDLDVLLIESNHDVRMLQAGPYPYYLKRRIMSEKGHLSNEDAGRILTKLLWDGMKHVFLGHLSRENNFEELAFETVSTEITLGECPYMAGDFPISIAHRDLVSEHIEF